MSKLKGFYSVAAICNSCGFCHMKKPTSCDCGNDESVNGFEPAAIYIASELFESAYDYDRLVEALRDLLDEYESQESQFGHEYLWQKYSGEEGKNARALLAQLDTKGKE